MKKWQITILIMCLLVLAGAKRPSPVQQLREMQKRIEYLESQVEYNLQCIQVLMEKNGIECPSKEERVKDVPDESPHKDEFFRMVYDVNGLLIRGVEKGQRGRFLSLDIDQILDERNALVMCEYYIYRRGSGQIKSVSRKTESFWLSSFPTEVIEGKRGFGRNQNRIEYRIKGAKEITMPGGKRKTLMVIVPLTDEDKIREYLTEK